jgi:hypothetical protein
VEDDELLRDRVLVDAFGATPRDVPVRVVGLERRDVERDRAVGLFALEKAHEWPALDRWKSRVSALSLFALMSSSSRMRFSSTVLRVTPRTRAASGSAASRYH